MIKMYRFALAGALAVAIAAPAVAGPARLQRKALPPRGPTAAADSGAEITPGEVQRMFEAWAIVQAQDALQLSDDQYGTFVTRLKALQDVRRQHQQARLQVLADLRKLTNVQPGATVDESAVRDRLKALRDEDDRAAGEIRKAADAVDQNLTPTQQARFRLFEERMEARKMDLVMRARAAARARKGGA